MNPKTCPPISFEHRKWTGPSKAEVLGGRVRVTHLGSGGMALVLLAASCALQGRSQRLKTELMPPSQVVPCGGLNFFCPESNSQITWANSGSWDGGPPAPVPAWSCFPFHLSCLAAPGPWHPLLTGLGEADRVLKACGSLSNIMPTGAPCPAA